MAEYIQRETSARIGARLVEAFLTAYPELSEEAARHAARNLAQVISGTIDIGRKAGGSEEVTHMDLANTLVYWCATGGSPEGEAPEHGRGAEGTATWGESRGGLAARAADLMLALEVLSEEPELLAAFIRGTSALGTSGWERDRGKIRY
jgi:hypothetical protein